MVPDQLLLQMLVDWLGPLTQERKKAPAKENSAKPAAERKEDQPKSPRPPLKVQSPANCCDDSAASTNCSAPAHISPSFRLFFAWQNATSSSAALFFLA